MSVEVTAITDEGRPAALRCQFERPLEDNSYVWTQRSAAGYQPFEVPAVGATVTLEGYTLWDMLRYRFAP